MILDSKGRKYSDDFANKMSKIGVELKQYNPFRISNPFGSLIYRMHDKVILVDRKEIFLGGRNIEDHYYGQAKRNFRDRDVFIQSETLGQEIYQYLSGMWNSDLSKKVNNFTTDDDYHNQNHNNEISEIDFNKKIIEQYEIIKSKRLPLRPFIEIDDANIHFVKDNPSHPGKKH